MEEVFNHEESIPYMSNVVTIGREGEGIEIEANEAIQISPNSDTSRIRGSTPRAGRERIESMVYRASSSGAS